MSVAERRALPWFYLNDYPIPLSSDLTSILGEIVVSWGAFENDLSRDIALLLRFPLARAHGLKIPKTAFVARMEFWRRSVDALFPTVPLYRELASSLAKEGGRIATKRNRLIHGQWRQNTDKSDPRWIVFSLKSVERTDIDGFYIDEKVATSLRDEIVAFRATFVEFVVNRHWHAEIGMLAESHEPTPDNPAHLTLRTETWPQSEIDLLDATVPARLARMYLLRSSEA